MPREATSDSLWNSSRDNHDDDVEMIMIVYNDVDNEDGLEYGNEQKAVFVHPTCHFEHVSCSASTFDGLP